MSNTIIHLFKDADMRNQHEGLAAMALAKKVKIDALAPGEHVVFLNSKLDRVKLYSHQGVLSYFRSPGGRLNLNMIEMIPLCFNAKGGVDWDKADKLAIEKLLTKKRSGGATVSG